MVASLRSFIIKWNNLFPLDRQYRVKRNILFNSPEHRALNQVDLYFQWLEDELYNEFIEEAKKRVKDKEDFDKGIWIKETEIDEAQTLEMFDKIDIAAINEANGPIQIK